MKKPTAAAAVVPLFGRGSASRFEGEREMDLSAPSPTVRQGPVKAVDASPALDLTGKTKIWFTAGAGNSGKTMLLRYLAEIMRGRGGEAVLAAVDPAKRTLASYIEGVQQPETNDPAQTAAWLEDLLHYVMENKTSALVDLGGGDTSLARLVDAVPDLAKTLDEAGVAPVACYTLTPRVADLATLASFEQAGFQPAATVLVLNEGRSDPMMDREEAFGRILRHSTFKAAVERGARVIWMPRLEPAVAQEIEAKFLLFAQARDGKVPDGETFPPLGIFDRSRVRKWMDAMAERFDDIRTWMP